MTIKKAFEGSVNYMQVIDENGYVDDSLFPKDLTDDKILEMYKYMLYARALDAKSLSLQRQGRLATYAPLIGEEATNVGTAMAMRPQDMFVPSFRQHGVFLVRGLSPELFFWFWHGCEDGGVIPESVNGLTPSIPVGSQMQHGMGIAYAMKYMKKDAVAIAYVGDGGTSEGDFYEALNFAGVYKVPLVAIIENNQWAISQPRRNQSAAETLAQKGIAAGINCVMVDGNDVIAVYKATKEAIENAKNGPTVIECYTYRLSMHTTSDDPARYREQAEVDAWLKKDPLIRIKGYLMKKGLWNETKEAQLKEEQTKLLDDGVDKAEKHKTDPANMFKHVYSFMPEILTEELSEGQVANFWLDEGV